MRMQCKGRREILRWVGDQMIIDITFPACLKNEKCTDVTRMSVCQTNERMERRRNGEGNG